MASILWNSGEQAIIETFLAATAVSPAIPGSGGNWGLGMGAGGSAATTTKSYVNGNTAGTIWEIGQNTPNGYTRQAITRDHAGTGWGALAIPSGSYQTQAPQQTFSFSGAPDVNGATLWFLAKSATRNLVDCVFGADLAATRTFANLDTEKIQVTFKMQ